MGILLVALIATAFGGLLIFLLVAAGPRPDAAASGVAHAAEGSGAAYLAALPSSDLGLLLQRLLEAMGFDVELLAGPPEGVLLLAENATPVTGVRMLVQAHPGSATPADAETVRSFLELVRGEEAGKGLLVVASEVSSTVREACADSPVEVLACPELWKLIEKKLPEIARTRRLRTAELD